LGELGIGVIATCRASVPTCKITLQVRMQFRCTEPITMNDVVNNWRHRYTAGLRYMLTGKGLLSVGAGYAGAFLRTRPELASPDVQIHFLIFSTETAGATLHRFSGFMASACQLRPDSRGFVRIKSSDPSVPPAIQPRYLSHRNDCETIVAGLRKLREVMNQPVMRRYIAEERMPGPQCSSDADLLAHARSTRHHGLSSDLDLPHGRRPERGGRRAPARTRLREASRGRRLDHAHRSFRQH